MAAIPPTIMSFELTPERVLAISMFSLLFLGMGAQAMQQCGCARYAPVVILSLLLIVSIGGMMALSGQLSASPDWHVAADQRP